ncbi:hypothetical protein [Luteimonas lutimaris]|uniref:DUF1269 domain-containing protein n=1 Tax=Luteimonas lutimaris TaxID=698645 RepID=A0ABP7MMU7_9GAMM|nr:hypothetical protein [Luteimonas sp.]
MKTRHVFMADTVADATAAIAAAKAAGIDEQDISLVADSSIEMQEVPDALRNAGTDFMPAAKRGAITGGTAGLVGGLVGVVVPPIGLTVAGVAITTLVGAAVGTWVTSLVGSMVPDEVHRRFESEIRAGRILIVIDAEPEVIGPVEAALREAGAEQLPYEATSALQR